MVLTEGMLEVPAHSAEINLIRSTQLRMLTYPRSEALVAFWPGARDLGQTVCISAFSAAEYAAT